MFIEAIVVGLLISIIVGARLENLSNVNIKCWILIVIGVIMQLLPIFLPQYQFTIYLQLVGAVMVFIAVIINYNARGFWIIFIGGLMNFIAIMLNQYKMPVDLTIMAGTKLSGLMDTIISGDVVNYVAASSGNWSNVLGKIMITPKWYPFTRLLSIGDIIISLGIIRFIYGESKRKNLHKKTKMVQFAYKKRI